MCMGLNPLAVDVHGAHNLYQLPVYFLSAAVLHYKNLCFSYVGISM